MKTLIEEIKLAIQYNEPLAEDKDDALSEKGKSFMRGYMQALTQVKEKIEQRITEDD